MFKHFCIQNRSLILCYILIVVTLAPIYSAGQASTSDESEKSVLDYPIQPAPFTCVHFNDAFWKPRIETNRTVTIPYAFKQCEEHGRMDNFLIAGGKLEGGHSGSFPFDDTDPYKILEGASYTLSVKKDEELESYLDNLISMIADAQEEDGYLYTCRTNNYERLRNWMGPERWSKLSGSHELYNAGHMYEAAAAHYAATGKRSFLDVAIKNANLIYDTFGLGKIEIPPGHQIIEMGLVRLYRATKDKRYLDLAKYFLDIRGVETKDRKPWGPYNQDHCPIIEQDEAVGHAVRAMYMYAGIADVAALTGDESYKQAIDRLWDNVVSKKLYITGGIGATSHGEAFGKNYELPNMSAYCETCAAIGNVYWNHRLFLLHGDAKYIDVMERTLYNGLLSGISLDGEKFFYPNPLESQGQHERSPWFGCACCPGNMTRFLASIPGYVYAAQKDNLYLNLYVQSEAEIEMENQTVSIQQETQYPWNGYIKVYMRPEKTDRFTLCLRIPGWAQNQAVPSDLYSFLNERKDRIVLQVNNKPVQVSIQKGYVKIDRQWKQGDTIELRLPMPIRRIIAHENVKDDRGKAALQRGPIVYCAEWPDQPEGRVLNLLLDDSTALRTEYRSNLFDGIQVIRGKAAAFEYVGENRDNTKSKIQDFTAIPYYAWAHRGKGQMAVWLPRTKSAVRPIGAPTIASNSVVTTSGGQTPTAINDQIEPKNSNDHSVQFFHWWPKKGTTEWAQYDFDGSHEVSTVEVYWFDDTGQGECRVPASWKILYRFDGKWKPVWTEETYGVNKDQFNKVVFETVKTNALRLEVKLQEQFSAGIHEWRVR